MGRSTLDLGPFRAKVERRSVAAVPVRQSAKAFSTT